MIITKQHVPRRTMLRGLGAAIALPLLDSMVPAATALRYTAAAPVRRLGVVYVPNGMNLEKWVPATEGAGFEFTPILEPLAPFRNHLVLLSGMANNHTAGLPGEGVGHHSRGQAAFLTGMHAKKTEGPDISAGTSMDQIAASQLGTHTQLASLELALEANDMLGVCDSGYSCAYSGTISWRTPTTPLPMETDPRAVFERLFGDGGTTDPAMRARRVEEDRSLLDLVTDDVETLERRLGPRDRTKLTEYLDSLRDIERRINLAAAQQNRELPVVEQPSGAPDEFADYAALMFDLMALAYQSDLTRVATFLMGREVSGRTFPEIGVPEPHHAVSHHGNRPEQLEKLMKINAFHMELFAHLLEKLRSTPDGDGSLLDHVTIIYGPGFSDPNRHWHKDVPIVLAGTGAGTITGGRHIRFTNEPPLANLHVTVLDKMGIALDQFGDSTSRVEALSAI